MVMPEVESTLPKGVLPDNFFDDRVEGAVAMGEKRKDAEKRIQQCVLCIVITRRKDWKEFKKFEQLEAESGVWVVVLRCRGEEGGGGDYRCACRRRQRVSAPN